MLGITIPRKSQEFDKRDEWTDYIDTYNERIVTNKEYCEVEQSLRESDEKFLAPSFSQEYRKFIASYEEAKRRLKQLHHSYASLSEDLVKQSAELLPKLEAVPGMLKRVPYKNKVYQFYKDVNLIPALAFREVATTS